MQAVNIDALLSQTRYQNPRRVRDDITNLCTNVKTLLPKLGTLIHNNGSESTLILLGGTIPIYFGGSQYNIPLEFYLYESYPLVAPRIFVRPTPTMIIKPGHQNIDVEGGIFMSYLSEWSNSSSLVELVALLASLFSMDPPLYSKPPGYQPPATTTYATSTIRATGTVTSTQPPNTGAGGSYAMNGVAKATESVVDAYRRASGTGMNTNASVVTVTAQQQQGGYPQQQAVYGQQQSSYPQQQTYGTVSVPNPMSNQGGAQYAANPLSYGSSSYQTAQAVSNPSYNSNATYGSVATTSVAAVAATTTATATINSGAAPTTSAGSTTTTATTPSARYRPQLEAELTIKLKRDLRDYYVKLKQEVDNELSSQWSLQNSADSMNDSLAIYVDFKDKLLTALQEIRAKAVELDAWNKEMESRGAVNVETYLQPYDELSAQIVRLQAEVMAVDDAIYYLEKALANSVIDLNTFLKETRNLARIQFMAKSHLMKINASVSQAVLQSPPYGR